MFLSLTLLGILIVIIGCSVAAYGFTKNDPYFIYGIVVVVLAIALVVVMHNMYGNEVRDLYENAIEQGVLIDYNTVGEHVYATKPCTIELDWQKDEGFFTVKGTGSKATPEVLKTLCDAKK